MSKGLRWLRDGGIVLVASAALFAALEVGVRLLAPQDSTMTYEDGESLGLPDDELGHVNRPGAVAHQSTPEFDTEYRITPQGFREAAVYEARSPDSSPRVLLLGDSFTFGAGVPYDATLGAATARQLAAEGRTVDVINAGVSGYDTRKEALYLDRLLPALSPDLVVVVFLPNDLFTNRPLDEPIPSHEKDLAVRLRSHKQSQLHVVTLLKRALMGRDAAYLRLYLRTPRAEYYRVPPSEKLAAQMATTTELFREAERRCRDHGTKLVVLSIPQLFQVVLAASSEEDLGVDAHHIDRAFTSAADGLGFEWVPTLPDLTAEYRSGNRELYYRFDGHLTEEGHRVVADRLRRVVLRHLAE